MTDEAKKYLEMPMDELEAQLLANYRPENSITYTGDAGAKPPAAGHDLLERITESLKNRLNETPAQFKKSICGDLKYCERRNSDSVALVITLADTAFVGHFAVLFPPCSLAAYIVRKKLLDPLCGCNA